MSVTIITVDGRNSRVAVAVAAGTADSVMPLTYEQLLPLTGGVVVPVR